MIGATVIIGVFYVFMMYALSAGSHLNDPAQLKTFIADPTPFPTLAHRYANWMTNIIDIAAVFGLFSCFLAVQNATVRVIFSMGRDKVLPGVLGKVAPAVPLALHGDLCPDRLLDRGRADPVAVARIRADRCVWLDRLARHRRRRPRLHAGQHRADQVLLARPRAEHLAHVVAPILGIVALGYPLWSVAKPGQTYPYNLVPYVVLAWVIAGIGMYYYFRSNDPKKLEAVGRALAEDEEDLAEGKLLSGPIHATNA